MRRYRAVFCLVGGVEVVKPMQAVDMLHAICVAHNFADCTLSVDAELGNILSVKVTQVDPPVAAVPAAAPVPLPEIPAWEETMRFAYDIPVRLHA